MRRTGVPLPPDWIWLGESWEEPPARRAQPERPQSSDRGEHGERRTVVIRGRGAERDLTWSASYRSRDRPSRPRHERPGFRPDRAALWAVLLGLLLVLVAATSAHAASRSRAATRPTVQVRSTATAASHLINPYGTSTAS